MATNSDAFPKRISRPRIDWPPPDKKLMEEILKKARGHLVRRYGRPVNENAPAQQSQE